MKAPTAKEVLKKHLEGIKFPYNPNLESSFINAVHEYTQAHTKELRERVKELELEANRKPLRIPEARELVNQMRSEKISFGRFIELINEGGKK